MNPWVPQGANNKSSGMLTLFASISGGLDWESAIQPLRMVSPWAVGLVPWAKGAAFVGGKTLSESRNLGKPSWNEMKPSKHVDWTIKNGDLIIQTCGFNNLSIWAWDLTTINNKIEQQNPNITYSKLNLFHSFSGRICWSIMDFWWYMEFTQNKWSTW